MDFAHRLLVLACSQRKRAGVELLPAIERYDGPTFRVLRAFLRDNPNPREHPNVFILSAAYGLIPAAQPISHYDQLMTAQRADELRIQVLKIFSTLPQADYTEICFALGKTYKRALVGWTKFASPFASVTIVEGAQGVKLARLRCWLRKEESTDRKSVRPCTIMKPRGIAHLHGIEIRRTPVQIFEHARAALQDGEAGASVLRHWYVQIDNYRIAPKWLVSSLTGLSVSQFTSEDARRVLGQLGIQTQRIGEEGEE